jgi:phosphoribosylanthranilate isomerase
MIIQIYEIQTPEEAEACIALGVDHIGSVILSDSDWHVPKIREVIHLSRGTTVKNSLIPLLRDRNVLFRAMDYYEPHCVHFCESLMDPSGRILSLDFFIDLQVEFRQRFPEIRILRSIPLPPESEHPRPIPSLQVAAALEPHSDLFLLDTWLPEEPVKGFIGITGRTGAWDKARELVLETKIPVLLAGGLSPENVYDALTKVMPSGADSCTHTNMSDRKGNKVRFRKDLKRVEAFVNEVRRGERTIKRRREDLMCELAKLKEELRERQAAIPPHSIRPQQILRVEELEDEIALMEKEIEGIRKF